MERHRGEAKAGEAADTGEWFLFLREGAAREGERAVFRERARISGCTSSAVDMNVAGGVVMHQVGKRARLADLSPRVPFVDDRDSYVPRLTRNSCWQARRTRRFLRYLSFSARRVMCFMYSTLLFGMGKGVTAFTEGGHFERYPKAADGAANL